MKFQPNTPQFFDAMYLQNSDPWKFATDDYELQRYATLFHAVSHQRYQNIFEPGCSIGMLTEKLATIAASVQAFDVSQQACLTAKEHCASLANVTINCASLENVVPAKDTNLIILSEIGYYFTEKALSDVIENLLTTCSLPLTFLASHWLGHSEDHILSGDRVQEIIASRADLKLEYHISNAGFRLDRWSRQ